MKTTVKPLTKVKGLGDIETPESNPLLIHFLSPLERAAFRNKFQAFIYNIDGVELEVTSAMCRDLYWNSKRHIVAYRKLLQPSRQKLLKQDPEKRQFLHKRLHAHNLPTRLYHILNQYGCYSMGMVADKGEYELKRMRGLGKKQFIYLVKLFIDNGCQSLFL